MQGAWPRGQFTGPSGRRGGSPGEGGGAWAQEVRRPGTGRGPGRGQQSPATPQPPRTGQHAGRRRKPPFRLEPLGTKTPSHPASGPPARASHRTACPSARRPPAAGPSAERADSPRRFPATDTGRRNRPARVRVSGEKQRVAHRFLSPGVSSGHRRVARGRVRPLSGQGAGPFWAAGRAPVGSANTALPEGPSEQSVAWGAQEPSPHGDGSARLPGPCVHRPLVPGPPRAAGPVSGAVLSRCLPRSPPCADTQTPLRPHRPRDSGRDRRRGLSGRRAVPSG